MQLQWEDQHPQPKQKFICRLMEKLQYLRQIDNDLFNS